MYALNEMQALEHGSGADAKTGVMGSYEEMWTDCEVLSCVGGGGGDGAGNSAVAVDVNGDVKVEGKGEGGGSGDGGGGKEGSKGPKTSITLRHDNPSKNTRGVVVRVGQFVQGIVMHGSDVTVERWEYIFSADSAAEGTEAPTEPPTKLPNEGIEAPNEGIEEDEVVESGNGKTKGQWRRTIRIGNAFLPCALTFKDDGAACVEGGDVEFKGVEWRVEEVVRWGDVVQFGV